MFNRFTLNIIPKNFKYLKTTIIQWFRYAYNNTTITTALYAIKFKIIILTMAR